ncbi:MAG TPA: hypothetical protein O0X32_01765 [Methanocorpusculum sp.]|nr:hypothetical protein [Methanocorpusculum sp.]
MGIFSRIFSWKRILREAFSALNQLDVSLRADAESLCNAELHISSLMEQKEELKKMSLERYTSLKEEYESLTEEVVSLREKLSAEESVKELRSLEYERKVEKLNTLIEQMEDDHRLAEEKARVAIEERNRILSTTWHQHEQQVETTLKNYAKRYDFIRCEKEEYPYNGTPDNVFYIGNMYTVFDAKSPKNPEELKNFPTYLKKQAEAMSKYCKNENVRKDAFLVVPVSTLDALDTFIYPLADYTVYVITLEAVLPILHMLKTLEDYEFAEQLSPEDCDKLCRFIGKLSHTTKRKVQIDTYFSHELVGVLREIDLLPDDFVHDISQYEQRAKLNPPQEKRSKVIAVSDISEDVEKLENEILGWSLIRE